MTKSQRELRETWSAAAAEIRWADSRRLKRYELKKETRARWSHHTCLERKKLYIEASTIGLLRIGWRTRWLTAKHLNITNPSWIRLITCCYLDWSTRTLFFFGCPREEKQKTIITTFSKRFCHDRLFYTRFSQWIQATIFYLQKLILAASEINWSDLEHTILALASVDIQQSQ